jgi:hypothetical protein
MPEQEHACNEQSGINDAGYQYPTQQPVLLNKIAGIFKSLERYYDFFEQV